jgi:hypothetical protein
MKTNKKGISAAAFMACFSSAGRDIAGPKVCCNCKLNRARWDSIYCSDACKTQFLTFREPSKFTVVERWDGQKWIEVRLEWDGTAYKEIA